MNDADYCIATRGALRENCRCIPCLNWRLRWRDARIAELEREKDSLVRQNVSLADDCRSLRRELSDTFRERDELRAAHDSVPAGVGIDDDADYWTPMATPLLAFRKNLSDFPQRRGFLTPDPDRQAEFRKQLAGFGPGLKVGIYCTACSLGTEF